MRSKHGIIYKKFEVKKNIHTHTQPHTCAESYANAHVGGFENSRKKKSKYKLIETYDLITDVKAKPTHTTDMK